MATLEEIKAEKARRDAEGAKLQALIEMQRKAQFGFTDTPKGGSSVNQENIPEFKRGLTSLTAGAVNGATLGLADEATGVVRGAQALLTGEPVGEAYSKARDAVRNRQGELRASNPMEFGTGEIGGTIAPALASAPYAVGKTALGTVMRGAGIGGAEGAIYGGATGEGFKDRLGNAAKMGAIGAGIGAAAPVVFGALRGLTRAGRDMAEGGFGAVTGRASQRSARDAIAETLRKSGQSVDDITAAVSAAGRQGQPEFRLMDALGNAGARRASGIARTGGDGAEEIARFLRQRQIDQGDRMAGFVDDAFGGGRQTALEATNSMKAQRGAAANTAYDAARGNAAPVDVRGALETIDRRIGGMRGSNVDGDGIDGALAGFRRRLAADPAPNGEISRELSDFDRVLGVKQDVQDAIGVAVRQGRNNKARELTNLRDELDSALEASSPSYRAANDDFRTASRNIDAIGSGEKMARPSIRARDTINEFSAMTPEEQAAARIGYGDRALKRIEGNSSPTANKAKPFTSTKAAKEADVIARDPNLFKQRIAREGAMHDTQARALGGSLTADNLQDISNTGVLSNLARSASSLVTGHPGVAAQRAAAALGPIVSGQSEATRALISKMLMSNDPAAILEPIMKSVKSKAARNRLIEALIRGAGRHEISN